MSAAVMMEQIAEASPRFKARIAGVFYLLTFVTGITALLVRSRLGLAAGLIAAVCYLVVTLIFYQIFKPVSQNLSLLATFVSLVGIAIGPLSQFLPALPRPTQSGERVCHYVRKYESAYLVDQVYLNPHPDELMLLNHL